MINFVYESLSLLSHLSPSFTLFYLIQEGRMLKKKKETFCHLLFFLVPLIFVFYFFCSSLSLSCLLTVGFLNRSSLLCLALIHTYDFKYIVQRQTTTTIKSNTCLQPYAIISVKQQYNYYRYCIFSYLYLTFIWMCA